MTAAGTIGAVEAGAALREDFDAVVRVYRPRIFRFVLASLRDSDAAETITQDCFLRAHRGRDGFRGDSSLETWLMQIAVNLVRDHTRNRRWQFWRRAEAGAARVETVPLGDNRSASPEKQALLAESVAAVWEAAGGLPERQRTVFLLRFVEDMDLLEIAAATGMAEGTVKAHLFRALQTVRERLGKGR